MLRSSASPDASGLHHEHLPSTREKEGEIVLGENEFKEFAVEVCADAVVECAGKKMLKRIPVGVLGIAGVGVVVLVGVGAGRGAGYSDGGLVVVVVIEATAASCRRE
ncbi:hypothetical protein BC332_11939 [Capsicum chinense]|nr:hypothetical protein BC332_11939 [Capsicum chinense]